MQHPAKNGGFIFVSRNCNLCGYASSIYLYVHVDSECSQSLSHDDIVVNDVLQTANCGVNPLEVAFYL